MNKNIGNIDKILRLVVALMIVAYGVVNSSLLGLVAIVPLATALMSWCPLYTIIGIKTTCSIQEETSN